MDYFNKKIVIFISCVFAKHIQNYFETGIFVRTQKYLNFG